ncbi:TlpA disulfide reductase family protein [Rhodopseudomonas palustris]|uniref:thiol:disulfide interchange protein TlpA n=1 Tax=Rhodopseudomonas palustris TaxID=1076 RepID=UPI002ACDAF0C|nr:TlpA disulfide reductase family protein [Rhodopseudomonas palustris]WQG98263.1 TlpA disulfide reductase family protein [Rhodopseudomonas palustris]
MTETQPSSTPPRHAGRRTIILAAIAVLVVAGAAGVYGIGGLQRNAGDPTCRPAVALAQQLKPLARGEVAAVTMASAPLKLPDLVFQDGAGQPKKLSDFRGKTLLVNLWATWCVPCRKEMPALDNLQGKLGGKDFEVVAINIDTRDPAKPKKFLDDEKLTRLSYFTDASARVFQDLKSVGRALGMPTSVLVDGKGCEIATIAGPAEWDSEDALALVRASLTR